MFRFLTVLPLVWFIAACVTPVAESDSVAHAAASQEEGASQRGLPAQELLPNECGLFLWSKTDASKFVFFAKAGANEALFLLDEQPTRLETISEQGDIFGQFFTELSYQTESGRQVSLSYEPGAILKDGARISNGIIQFPDVNGWATVMPVIGARVCQPAFNAELVPNASLN